MATTTPRLGLRKPDPDPGTGDLINVTTDISDSMDKIDAAMGATICTSGTRPIGAARWDGRIIFETDTRRNYMWHEALTTWLPLLIGRGTDGPYLLGQSTDTSGEGFNVRGSVATAKMWQSRATTDANPRFTIDADGRLQWGPGSAAVDTNLRRSAVDTLRTDDSFSVGGNLTVTGTAPMNKLAESVLGSAVASVTFSSIPQTYRSLMLSIAVRSDAAGTSTPVMAQFNGDVGANYDRQQLIGNASTTTSAEQINVTGAYIGDASASGAAAGAASIMTVFIPLYSTTSFWKQITSNHLLSTGTGTGSLHVKIWGSRRRNTAAITSILIKPDAGNFIAGSSFTLYGLL